MLLVFTGMITVILLCFPLQQLLSIINAVVAVHMFSCQPASVVRRSSYIWWRIFTMRVMPAALFMVDCCAMTKVSTLLCPVFSPIKALSLSIEAISYLSPWITGLVLLGQASQSSQWIAREILLQPVVMVLSTRGWTITVKKWEGWCKKTLSHLKELKKNPHLEKRKRDYT